MVTETMLAAALARTGADAQETGPMAMTVATSARASAGIATPAASAKATARH